MITKWVKSTRCESNSCVECRKVDGGVEVRNSTNPDHVLFFTDDEWQAFIGGAQDGDFNQL